MRILVSIRKHRDPRLWKVLHLAWECIPRVGDLFAVPDYTTDDGMELGSTGIVKRVCWCPLDLEGSDPTVSVDVEVAD